MGYTAALLDVFQKNLAPIIEISEMKTKFTNEKSERFG